MTRLLAAATALVAVAAATTALALAPSASAVTPTQPSFVALSSTLTVPRYGTAAAPTLGKVLFVGGAVNVGFGSSAATTLVDLFNPAQGTSGGAFGPLSGAAGMLETARYFPFAAPLPGGRVLIGGGFGPSGNALASAEIYDPATGGITALPTPPQVSGPETELHVARYGAFAAPLADGRVLVGGGRDNTEAVLRSAEIFDPTTDDFTTDPQLMESTRYLAAAAPISGGRVLIAGGQDLGNTVLANVEIYDPTTGGFAEPPGGMTRPRVGAIAAPLADGKVLIAGGETTGSPLPIRGAEIYDPAASSSIQLPESGTTELTIAREAGAAAALPDGRILIAGGTHDTTDALSGAEVYLSASEARAPDTDFGDEVVGATAAKKITVTDVGAQALDIEGFALGGANADDFSVGSSTCPSVPVAFDGTCTITVDFDPSATGHRVATVRLSDNEPVPLTTIVSGTGVTKSSTGSGGGGGSTGSGSGGGGSTGGGPRTTSTPPAGPHFDVLRCRAVKVLRTVNHRRRTVGETRCTLGYAKGRVALGARSNLATLSRNHAVYATGLATTSHASVLELTARRTLVRASYQLYVSFAGKDGRRHTTHKTIRLTSG
jgi:uncharacterized membrane protein YgcG